MHNPGPGKAHGSRSHATGLKSRWAKVRQLLCPRREGNYATVPLTRDRVPVLAGCAAVTGDPSPGATRAPGRPFRGRLAATPQLLSTAGRGPAPRHTPSFHTGRARGRRRRSLAQAPALIKAARPGRRLVSLHFTPCTTGRGRGRARRRPRPRGEPAGSTTPPPAPPPAAACVERQAPAPAEENPTRRVLRSGPGPGPASPGGTRRGLGARQAAGAGRKGGRGTFRSRPAAGAAMARRPPTSPASPRRAPTPPLAPLLPAGRCASARLGARPRLASPRPLGRGGGSRPGPARREGWRPPPPPAEPLSPAGRRGLRGRCGGGHGGGHGAGSAAAARPGRAGFRPRARPTFPGRKRGRTWENKQARKSPPV